MAFDGLLGVTSAFTCADVRAQLVLTDTAAQSSSLAAASPAGPEVSTTAVVG